MQQTFEINTGKISTQFLESILAMTKARFGARDVKITIEDVEAPKPISQIELFQKMEEHRKNFSHVKVDPTLDLSALANEANDTPPMIYFDTDVLIHYLIEQDSDKHQQAIRLYQEVSANEQFFISFLCLQEVAFVLAKLKIDAAKIDPMLNDLMLQTPMNYGVEEFSRGKELAGKIGFQNISDCLHTAIAETYCQELYTFNKSDFKRIQQYTKLKITIL